MNVGANEVTVPSVRASLTLLAYFKLGAIRSGYRTAALGALDAVLEHLRRLSNYLIQHKLFMNGDVSGQFLITTQTMRMAVYKFLSGTDDFD